MTRKLLNKTLRVYVVFSVIVLVVSAPLFYWLTERLYIEDADETLYLRKEEFLKYNLPTIKTNDISTWNKINRDVRIEDSWLNVKKDSIFYTFYLDSLINENEPYRVLLTPVVIENKPFVLMARINLVESEDMLKGIAVLFCVILSSLLIGLYFITKRLSSKLWLPFYSTLDQVETFELGRDIKPELVQTDVEEFVRLNNSITHLLEKNLSAYKSQQEFIENAAHELQTPLAVFQAKLDLLVQHVPLTDELGDILSKLNEAASRLNRINKNLLLLSKIENNQYVLMEQVRVADLLEKQAKFLGEQAEERKVNVIVKNVDSNTIKANLTLLEIAISNLLLNALRHNEPRGQIVIDFQQNKLTISNTSQQSILTREKLFQRFSNPAQDGGSGLGLSIVKKICDLHGWTVNYAYREHLHIFQIAF